MEETIKIQAMIIIEVLGKPKEHLTQTLDILIKKLNDEKGVEVTDKKIHDPVLLKEEKDIYTTYAEVDISVESMQHIMGVMLKYMPAHLEIISPERLNLSNNDVNEVLNEFVRKLHQYDEAARVIQTEKVILERKLKEILEKKKD